MIAVISLYRPGPMDSIPTYIRNRHNPSLVTYKHHLLKDILDVTYGCIVYQEQVMQIFRTLAGYSYGRADIVRRAMAKKKHDVLENERKAFVYGEEGQCAGAVANGVSVKIANEIFDEMISFASYAFNKSHAAAYATISYQTAYLKCHYYKEYMAALMTITLLDSTDKLYGYTADVARNGIKLLPIDINKSNRGFTAEPDGIRFALLAVKSLGEGAINAIIKEREDKGSFASLQDFCSRMTGREIHLRTCEALIKSGAFDCFPNNRHEMLNSCEMLMQAAAQESRVNLEGQLDFFGGSVADTTMEMKIQPAEEYSYKQLLEFEHEAVGMYISGHPIDEFESIALASGCCDILTIADNAKAELKGFCDGDYVDILAMFVHRKMFKTKSGAMMCFTDFEDKTGSIEVIVFPTIYETMGNLLKDNSVLHIRGKISMKDEEPPKLIAELIETAERFSEQALNKNICVRVNSTDIKLITECKRLAMENYDPDSPNKLNIFFGDIRKMTAVKSAPTVKLTVKLIEDFQKTFGDKNVLFM